jgi:hypothetical protein
MSRTLPYLSELQPEFFVEISPELAELRGLTNGEYATLVSSRTAIEAKVLVTERIRPIRLRDGQVVHQIGMPYHWSYSGISTGDGANDLLGIVLDPNTHIQEDKVSTADIRPGRRPARARAHRVRGGLPAAGRCAVRAGRGQRPRPGRRRGRRGIEAVSPRGIDAVSTWNSRQETGVTSVSSASPAFTGRDPRQPAVRAAARRPGRGRVRR